MVKKKVEKVKKLDDVPGSGGDQAINDIPEVKEILDGELRDVEDQVEKVSEELAGELLNLPFAVADMLIGTGPLTEQEIKRMAGPFSRVLEKLGLEKLSRDEVVFGFWLSVSVLSRVKIYQEKKRVENEIKNRVDGRKEGDGENNLN